MGYCKARLVRELEEKTYRVYVTDALKLTGENTARFVGGSWLSTRWLDALTPEPQRVVDDRKAEEIAADIWARAGLGGKGGERK